MLRVTIRSLGRIFVGVTFSRERYTPFLILSNQHVDCASYNFFHYILRRS